MKFRPSSVAVLARVPRWQALSVAIIMSVNAAGPAFAQQGNAAPPAVVVAPIAEQDVSRSDRFVGRVQAIQSVNLVARVEGFLEQINFKEGSTVKKNDLLIGIEKAPYQAQLAAAQGQLASANATLVGTQAKLKNADVVLARQKNLLQRDVASQAQADDAQANRDVAAANVQEAQAAIEQAKAQVQTAELNLSYTDIISPIDGRTGVVSITEGNLVNTQSGTIATVVQIDPIRVAFSIPETLFTRIAQAGFTKSDRGQTVPNVAGFTPEIILPGGTAYGHDGKITFASNQIDAATGTLVIYADFPNPDGVLLPGAFVNVVVKQAQGQLLPIVPVSAVLQDQQGRYVFVIDSDNKAEVRRIETAGQIENGFPVTKGLTAGETVIVQGLQKVRPGIEVTPTPAKPTQPGDSTSSAASTSPGAGSSSGTAPASGGSGTAPAASGGTSTTSAPAPASGNTSSAPASTSGSGSDTSGDSAGPSAASDSAGATDSSGSADSSGGSAAPASGNDASSSTPASAQ
ncbi:efflux transporter periplasmic adaptor subunit [Acuticoccus sediminis]|uniref:Efflux transporter periplasmic adaptor subunit n=1 Tax=Acuticoccus sediminis TaxID=2184697 RepID=A0A8B2NNC6_9HYPH|nr:efflux RND transporter periplasmic adaptor subunit [Acuticoccus sediminis]RAI00111.1 efflux transporter periplasmic adaptor subunit [Acuticoccus sediminis]